MNAAAARIANEARKNAAADHEVWIAGSMSAVVFTDEKRPKMEELQANFERQAEILAEGGVDFFTLEMMNDIEPTLIAYHAAAKTGLPVIVGFNAHTNGAGEIQLGMGHYPSGRPLLSEGIQALPDGVPMITICLLYTSPSPRDKRQSRMPSSA